MARFVAVLDTSGKRDLAAALATAEQTMIAGGSLETSHRWVRPGFGLLILAHGEGDASWTENDGRLQFASGFGWAEPRGDFLDACATALRAPERHSLPVRAREPGGSCLFAAWDPEAKDLVLATEPNGYQPVYYWSAQGTTVIASEPKAIWSLTPEPLEVDADALIQLWTLGHSLAPHSLLRDVHCAASGACYRFADGGATSRSFEPELFSDERSGDTEALAGEMNRALLEILASCRQTFPRVTVSLSGGMDSRYVLGGAVKTWPSVETFTFGEPGGADVELAGALAARAGVPHRQDAPDGDFLTHWGPFAVWRSDGMLSCIHAHGMDVVIRHAGERRHILNGFLGDIVMGGFLRPSHFALEASPERAASAVLAAYRFHAKPIGDILKPEITARATTTVETTLQGFMASYRARRLGNMLNAYWLRDYAPRCTRIGLALEEPWVRYLAPLVDPVFVRAAERIPLELRFFERVHLRALARLAPELGAIRWEKTGVAPRWPWPVHALGRYARKLGLLSRSKPAVDHASHMRGVSAPWVREVLLSPRTLAEGYLRPAYLEEIVQTHLSGREDRTRELSMALTVELWRRMFIGREGAPAVPHTAR